MSQHPTPPRRGEANNSRIPYYRIRVIHAELQKLYPKRHCVERYPSANSFAEIFNCNAETVREDIRAMIRDFNSPIQYFPTRWGYCYTEEVTSFPLDQISESEVFLLVIAGKCLGAFHGTSFSPRMKELISRVTRQLAEETLADLNRMESLFSFHPGGYEAPIDVSLFETTCEALFDQEGLRFTYTKIDDNGEPEAPEERWVNPRHLANVDNAWYLIADDLRRQGHRTFALVRMSNLTRTGERFVPTTELDVEAEIKKCFGIFTGKDKDPALVRLHFFGKARGLIAERLWHETQTLQTLPDGTLEFTMKVPHTPILDRWVLGFGQNVDVLEPASLQERFHAHIEGMFARLDAKRP